MTSARAAAAAENSHPRRRDTAAWSIALLGFALSLATAALARGRLHPDEVFQTLEPAHRLAFGYGEVTWEWTQGVRNWALPGLIAGLFKLAALAGATHPWTLLAPVWIACAAAQAFATLALHAFVEERDGRPAAHLAALLHVTWGGWLLYAARPLGDGLSMAPALGAILYLARARDGGRIGPGIAAGILVGIAGVIRYGALVLALPLAASLILGRRWRALAGFALGGAVVAAGLGALDLLTWGRPFQSLIAYLTFNRPAGGVVELFGARPWWWYAPIFAGTAPLLLALPFAQGLRRLDLPVGLFATYAAAIELHPHKEPRFLVALLPLMVVIAAEPAWKLLKRGWNGSRRWTMALIGLQAAWSVGAATLLRPFALRRELIDGEAWCGRQADLTGLLYAGAESWQGGGRFFIHRNVPVVYVDPQAPQALVGALRDSRLNCGVVEHGDPHDELMSTAGFRLAWQEGATVGWWRIRPPR